ncbi:LysR family transcriptional regulator [Marinobacterium rhizophilum]|uniref:LysR family transcriptional regulator n=1 Tax=Marinobacterium rhizophilum TaxID=420402 RepID=UPI0003A41C27|nr:LysR family transcriptional regulator [Marinobacterium rhizophilum]
MYFRSLRYFVAVYEELSFSAASKRCFVAQPSISVAVHQLETDLDCQLFLRHSKGVTPTPDGKTLYPRACKVLADIDEIKHLFHESAPSIPLRLALMPFLSGVRVSSIIKELLNLVEGLDLTVVDLNEPSDARIISSTQRTQDEAFHKLWVDQYVLAMPPNHPLSLMDQIPLEALDGLAFISRKPCDIDDAWHFAIAERGLQLDVKATVRTEEYALDLVAAGLGVSVVPSHSTGHRTDIVVRKVANIELERVVGFAYDKQKPLSSELLQAIRQGQQRFG